MGSSTVAKYHKLKDDFNRVQGALISHTWNCKKEGTKNYPHLDNLFFLDNIKAVFTSVEL